LSNRYNVQLVIGLFRMNKKNTPKISLTLLKNNLSYIPEAHTYLKWNDQILDYTNETSTVSDFKNELIEEIEIQPYQITQFKVDFHKKYLAQWLHLNKELNYSLEELWNIREQCIEDLSLKK
jgi:hypothetical protein